MLCPRCYHDIPPDSSRCPHCLAFGSTGREVPSPEETLIGHLRHGEGREPRQGSGVPWENRARIGTVAALGETLQGALFRPSAFFRDLPPGGKIGAAVLYAVIVGTLSAAVAMMWQKVLGHYPMQWMHEEWQFEWRGPHVSGSAWYAGLAVLPLLIAVSTVVRGLVLHLSLMILGGAKEPYEATLKVVAYATSASAFNVFPFCGSPIAFFWRVALLVTGLREVHRVSTGRAFLAWLLPFLVLACASAMMLAGLILGLMKMWPELGDLIEV